MTVAELNKSYLETWKEANRLTKKAFELRKSLIKRILGEFAGCEFAEEVKVKDKKLGHIGFLKLRYFNFEEEVNIGFYPLNPLTEDESSFLLPTKRFVYDAYTHLFYIEDTDLVLEDVKAEDISEYFSKNYEVLK